ncbi:hypothetical protein J2Z21_008367 [Streptomyces griseochromogenes]|uniref:Recombinase domain-containing protein n=1 Tax=Streptomyces griseochromogenes TaxID=68214 RepID=A0A1B1B406_9ACTN|nr:recombinase family protein [Streptomyces griseochromogenes]ANP53556.1 hypothetical protein AVL59_32015 [Streptomyces griseochromogenes]MBP2055353.1 hypothetical protein [Streptomyces griseochromogenes]
MGRLSGYVRDGVTHPAETPKLREAVALFLETRSDADAAAFLNKQGVTTPRGNEWRREVFHRWSVNPKIAGLDKAGEPIEGWGQRVLEPEVFRRVQETHAERDEQRAKPRDAYEYLLTGGCAVCGECSTAMIGSRAHADAPPSYKCDGCGKTRINADRLEDTVAEYVLAELLKPGARERLEALLRDIEAEVGRLREHIAGGDERFAGLKDLYKRGLMVETAFVEAKKATEKDLRDTRVRLKHLELMTDLPVGDVHDLVAWWRTASRDAKRGLVLLEIVHVRVSRRGEGGNDPHARVTIDWREPAAT